MTSSTQLNGGTLTTSSQRRVMLWAVPRSLSTAMLRVMMNSGLTTQILHEPYAVPHYYGPQRVSHRYPDVYADPEYSFENAKRALELPYPDKELVFAKDMPYYLCTGRLAADWIPDGYTHTFITRHPRSTVASFLRVIGQQMPGWSRFDPKECGYKEQVQMMRLLQQHGHRAIVLDADDLLNNPEGMLRAYCQNVGLEFRDSMINWEPLSENDFTESIGPKFGRGWHLSLTNATRLEHKPPSRADLSFAHCDQKTRDLVETAVAENVKYYEELYNLRLML